MSREPGMCPQRLFTNTKLFMIAGKRNPTRARSSRDLAGGAGAGAPRGGRLFLRSAPGKAAVDPGRGAAGPARSASAAATPPLSSRRRGAPAAAVLGPGRTWRPQLFPGDAPRSPLQPSPRYSAFLSSTQLKENSQCQRHSLRELRFQTKSCPYPQLRGSNQPLILTFSL